MLRIFLLTALVLIIIGGFFIVNQFFYVQKAHSSFENYYAFRGCQSLVQKTDMYATCKLSDGKVIKIVNVGGKWYLDGDLPVCYFNRFCL